MKASLKRTVEKLAAATPISVRQKIGRLGTLFGAEVTYPSILLAMRNLSRLGFRPAFIVDVGAYQGEWTTSCRTIFPDADVLMVEAQRGKENLLQKVVSAFPGKVSLAMVLLGPEEGVKVQFHEMETGSSVFAENSPHERIGSERVTRTLDGILEEHGGRKVDFLKLDVQGYELEVLKGAPRALRGADAVLMEASLIPVNTGSPTIDQVLAFMTTAGFSLFDVCGQGRRRDGVLWQVDLLFIRKGAPFSPKAEINHENWGSGGYY